MNGIFKEVRPLDYVLAGLMTVAGAFLMYESVTLEGRRAHRRRRVMEITMVGIDSKLNELLRPCWPEQPEWARAHRGPDADTARGVVTRLLGPARS